jgi:nitroreductase
VSTDPNLVYDAIRTRRVTRNMSTEPIEKHALDLVSNAARYAPNAGNRRLQPVITVTDPDTLRMLRNVAPGMLPIPQAIIVVCIDEQRAIDFGLRPGTPGLYIDVGTTAATLLLAAHAVGLASCPVTSFSRRAAARILGVQDPIKPQLMICLGHRAHSQPPPMPAATSMR